MWFVADEFRKEEELLVSVLEDRSDKVGPGLG